MKPVELALREGDISKDRRGAVGDMVPPLTLPFRVWWIPQMPGRPFEVLCESFGVAKALEDVLAFYDIHQYENRVKPDYCNTGGTEMWTVLEGESWDQGEWVEADKEDFE